MNAYLETALTAFVGVCIFIGKDFYLELRRRKEKILMDRIEKFYAPLYGTIVARALASKELGFDHDFGQKQIFIGAKIENTQGCEHLTTKSIEKFIFDNLGYASKELINVWIRYSASRIIQSDVTDYSLPHDLLLVTVKDYNLLMKKAKLEYSEFELKNGVPRMLVEDATTNKR